MPFNAIRLTELRKQRCLSVYELALESGVGQTDIHRLENGEYRHPSFNTVEKLSDFFRVNMETFRTKANPESVRKWRENKDKVYEKRTDKSNTKGKYFTEE